MYNPTEQIKNLRNIVENELQYFKSSSKSEIAQYIMKFRNISNNIIIPSGNLYINDMKIASGYNRLVIGGHGHYLEFTKEQLCFEPIIKQGQEWRQTAEFQTCKYEWLTHPDIDIKIYIQKNRVRYADYVPYRYYVDLLLFSDIEFQNETQEDLSFFL